MLLGGRAHQQSSWGFGRTCSSLLKLSTRKVSTAGAGLLAKCRVMPAGKDSTISPVIFTMHLQHREPGQQRGLQTQQQGGLAPGMVWGQSPLPHPTHLILWWPQREQKQHKG